MQCTQDTCITHPSIEFNLTEVRLNRLALIHTSARESKPMATQDL